MDGNGLYTVDFHTHLDRSRGFCTSGNIIRIISQEQDDREPLPENCFGTLELHPWHGHELSEGFELAAASSRYIGIGEVGMDRVRGKLSLSRQQEIFTQAIDLAEKLHKPLTVHCVKCFSELLAMKKARPWQVPTIIHYFRGNLELAKQLWQHDNFILSLPPESLQNRHLLDFLQQHPAYLQHIVLETDDPAGDIEHHYSRMAMSLAMNPDKLHKIMFDQFLRIYHP